MSEELTQEEIAELQKYLGASSPSPEEHHNVHKFLHDVSTSEDTTKTGYLSPDEVGTPKNPVRTFKSVALICRDILGNEWLAQHFLNEAEIVTSTSLSKDAKLLTSATTTTRQVADVSKKNLKPNKGWFKKKSDNKSEE